MVRDFLPENWQTGFGRCDQRPLRARWRLDRCYVEACKGTWGCHQQVSSGYVWTEQNRNGNSERQGMWWTSSRIAKGRGGKWMGEVGLLPLMGGGWGQGRAEEDAHGFSFCPRQRIRGPNLSRGYIGAVGLWTEFSLILTGQIIMDTFNSIT
jgi:hypothetical protein